MENFQIAIVFLFKDGFDIYIPTLETPIRFTFPKEIVQDMEIINVEKFISQVSNFITTYQIPVSTVTILISQTLLFIKDIQTTLPAKDETTPPQTLSAIEQQKIIQQFIDTVPFETIESKTFPIDGGIRIAATNKTLYDNTRIAFEKEGSTVKAIIPAFILGTANGGEGLTDEVITAVINNLEMLKQDSFTIHPLEILQLTPEEKKKEFLSLPKHQTKLYAYAGVFVLLLGALGLMFKIMLDSNAADEKRAIALKAAAAALPPAIGAVASPTPTSVAVSSFVASTTAPIDKSKIKIQIQTTAATATQGQLIKNKLVEKEYTNVTLSPNAPTATGKTLVIFSSTLDQTTQQDITSLINNIFTNFSTQQSAQTAFDITIIPSVNL